MNYRLEESTDILRKILGIMEDLQHLKDLDALLDRVLMEARRLINADAGSIFLVDGDLLKFSYIHNDSLFKFPSHKYLYANEVLPIDSKSIAGYVAATGESVIIDDAYKISASLPFRFNRSFDDSSFYRTKSILAVPLRTSRDKIVGVLQIINPLGPDKKVISFGERDKLVLSYFANNAAVAIERALMTREVILRMVKMCELRDPSETGTHANRVAAYAAEIYQKWAMSKGVRSNEIRKVKDSLRIGAMLHDLGKIAISDLILKKPGKLDGKEFALMQYHTIYGARLFAYTTSELDAISAEIALNHHERWDGNGYPGKIENIFAADVQPGPGKKGEEIPIYGRIVALADVYDALISPRAYKAPFPEEDVLKYLREQSGSQFDPEAVEAFFSIYEVIVAIREKYSESAPTPQENWHLRGLDPLG
jgi:HD-GYP domain-containing protein (c-di-GMP phosphodiesterase class II)